MKVQLVNPALAAGLIDPDTKRSPFIDPETKQVLTEATVPVTNFWVRRVLDGDLRRIDDQLTSAPTGREPIAPLTTRGKE